MKILHLIVMMTSLLVVLLLWLPLFILRRLFIHSLRVASHASEKVLDAKIEIPYE